ncbi:MAG: hypothetical protein WD426_03675 [Anditalea sp.]
MILLIMKMGLIQLQKEGTGRFSCKEVELSLRRLEGRIQRFGRVKSTVVAELYLVNKFKNYQGKLLIRCIKNRGMTALCIGAMKGKVIMTGIIAVILGITINIKIVLCQKDPSLHPLCSS